LNQKKMPLLFCFYLNFYNTIFINNKGAKKKTRNEFKMKEVKEGL